MVCFNPSKVCLILREKMCLDCSGKAVQITVDELNALPLSSIDILVQTVQALELLWQQAKSMKQQVPMKIANFVEFVEMLSTKK